MLVGQAPSGVKPLRDLSFGGVRSEVAGVAVDFIMRKDDAARLYEAARRSAVQVKGYPLRVARPDFLVAMKLYAPGEGPR